MPVNMRFPFSDETRAIFERRLQGQQLHRVDDPGLKRAAVTVPLMEENGEVAILLTRRTSKLRTNPGQWALPGGRVDAQETVEDAGLRELAEEVNLEPGRTGILGRMDDYRTRTGYVITPLVIWIADRAALAPNPDEVASLHPTRIEAFDRPDSPEIFEIPESERPVLRLYFDDSRVHAPTAAVLHQFTQLALTGDYIRVSHFEQPVWAWK